MKERFIGVVVAAVVCCLAGCDQEEVSSGDSATEQFAPRFSVSDGRVKLDSVRMDAISADEPSSHPERFRVLRQLLEAREATARYRDINRAIADGYADINVVVPHMGFHYLKAAYLDTVFDHRHPELLVYNRLPWDRHPRLVAVEYAVPLDLAENAPEGFAGDFDQWHRNEPYGLWTLHAWVWYPNPDGVFSELNQWVP